MTQMTTQHQLQLFHVVTASEAYKFLANALTWFETQEIDSLKPMQLRNLMALAKRAELC